MSAVVKFTSVSKSYPQYQHMTGGIKNIIFNFGEYLRSRSNQFIALDDISFEIKNGETVAFLGRNGAGKSTLLGLIAGVLRPTQGKVEIKNRVSPLLELGGGFHPELSGIENIQLNGVLMGLSRQQVKSKLEEIVFFSGLGDFIEQPIRTYSSGMTARLGFSVVAHLEPELLLIDEILAVGDAEFQSKCIDKMVEFKKSGVTIILVSHNANDIRALCQRSILIENHKIVADGESDAVLGMYESGLSSRK